MLPTIASLDIYTAELSFMELKHVQSEVGKLYKLPQIRRQNSRGEYVIHVLAWEGTCHHLAFDERRLIPSKGKWMQ